MENYYSTEMKWVKTDTHGFWACIHCDQPRELKYIATGHDHTDYHYNICNCEGAKANGKPYAELL